MGYFPSLRDTVHSVPNRLALRVQTAMCHWPTDNVVNESRPECLVLWPDALEPS